MDGSLKPKFNALYLKKGSSVGALGSKGIRDARVELLTH